MTVAKDQVSSEAGVRPVPRDILAFPIDRA